MQQYIGSFEITMHGIDLMQPFEAIQYLFQEGGCLILSQPFLLVEIHLQISSVTILHSDELCAFCGEAVGEFDDVLVFALSQHFDFSAD